MQKGKNQNLNLNNYKINNPYLELVGCSAFGRLLVRYAFGIKLSPKGTRFANAYRIHNLNSIHSYPLETRFLPHDKYRLSTQEPKTGFLPKRQNPE